MTHKSSFAVSMAAHFQKKPSLSMGGVALATALLLLLRGFFGPVAQGVAQQVDCTIQGCNVVCHNDFEDFSVVGNNYYQGAGIPTLTMLS